MRIWIDAQLSPRIAVWLNHNFSVEAIALRDIALRDAEDEEIFLVAKRISAVVITKDSDFLNLLERFGPPPQVIWLTCGNTSNSRLKEIFLAALPGAIALLKSGERLVEITDFFQQTES